jgi:hypothetical protein
VRRSLDVVLSNPISVFFFFSLKVDFDVAIKENKACMVVIEMNHKK